jgi:hypothetical protein
VPDPGPALVDGAGGRHSVSSSPGMCSKPVQRSAQRCQLSPPPLMQSSWPCHGHSRMPAACTNRFIARSLQPNICKVRSISKGTMTAAPVKPSAETASQSSTRSIACLVHEIIDLSTAPCTRMPLSPTHQGSAASPPGCGQAALAHAPCSLSTVMALISVIIG